MEFLFKKYFWVLNLAVILAAGFATSRALTSYLEFEVFKVPFVEASEGQEEVELDEEVEFRRPAALRSVDLERRRQLALAAAAADQPPETAVGGEKEEVAPETPVPAEETPPGGELSVEYVAAITTADESKNLALVKVEGEENKWVGIGDELKPGFKVTRITNYYIGVSQGVTELLWKKREAEDPKAKLAAGRGLAGKEDRDK